MNQSQKLSLGLFAGLACLDAACFAALISLLSLSLSSGRPVAGDSLWAVLSLSLAFAILTIGSLFPLSRFITSSLKSKRIKEIFGEDLPIFTPKQLAGLARRAKADGRKNKLICLMVSVKGPSNSSIFSMQRENAIKAMRHSYDFLRDKLPYATIGYSIIGGFSLLELVEDEAERLDEYRAIVLELSSSLQNTGALPYAYLLAGESRRLVEKGRRIDGKALLQEAEYALRHSANNRLSCDLQPYSPSLQEDDAALHWLDTDLSSAIERGELIVFYQAKRSLRSGGYYGAEALIRWKHPRRGLLPPSVFVPYCEYSGRIVEIDHFVFLSACKAKQEWTKAGRKPLTISVNLSRRTVYDPGLLDFLSSTVEKYGVDPSEMELELTESLAAENLVFISSVIKRIKELGFKTSIDDFGIGYSSLSALKSIPFDVLKIDKSFIDDLEIEKKSRDMVGSIISLVHALGMKVVAEGAESLKQVEILSSLGADGIQGYYFSRPLRKDAFEALVEEDEARRRKKEKDDRDRRKAEKEARQ